MNDSLDALSAESLAIQTLLAHVFDEISLSHPSIAQAIRRGFDHAASDLENLAIQGVKAPDPKRFVKALSVVEELRTATFGDQEKPKRGV